MARSDGCDACSSSEDSEDCEGSVLVIGGFRLIVQGRLVWLPHAAQRMVAYLAIKGGEHPRVEVARALWPGRADSSPHINLRQAIFQTRKTAGQLVEVTRHALSLAASVDVDLDRAAAQCEQLSAAAGETNLSLFSDDLVPSWRDSWLTVPRMSFRRLRLNALDAILESSLRSGDRIGAIDIARMIVTSDPSRQTARALLVEVERPSIGGKVPGSR